MVEVADDARDRMRGPNWFVGEGKLESPDVEAFRRADPWFVIESSTLPGVYPSFREARPGESLNGIPKERIVRNGSGIPRAIFEPGRLRQSYLCGDSNAVRGFRSLAEATSRTLIGASELEGSELAADVADLLRNPRRGIRCVFGTVIDPPRTFVAVGWQAGVRVYPEGVLIDLPISESPPGVGHWLLLLHRLSWGRIPGSPLQGQRLAWHENTTVPYEWVVEKEFDTGFPKPWRERFAQIPTTSYYSVLGEREHPLDVALASTFAIELLLSAKPRSAGDSKSISTKKVRLFYSYSHRDEKRRDKLEDHLAVLKRNGVIESWHDRKIGAGDDWKGKLDAELEVADIILLLVSSDFLNSDYCYDVEMKRALERHAQGSAKVIPIILKPCLWTDAPFGRLQALPTDGKAVTTWSNQDKAFTDIAKGLSEQIREWSERAAPPDLGP
jgi:hypothetical protein